MIAFFRMWFWRRKVRQLLEGAGCHDVRFIHERRRILLQVNGEFGVRAGYGESDFQYSQFYQLGDRDDLKRAQRLVGAAVQSFASRTIPHLALDGRPPDIGGSVPDDLIRYG